MWPMGLYLFVVLTDDDECTSGEANCDRNAKCINTLGSYKCDCVPGYSGDGYTCRGLTLLFIRSLSLILYVTHMLVVFIAHCNTI